MIDVIMPCWIINEELLQLTKSAVESLGKVNLIIIDNASTLGGGYLRSVADIYVRNKENLGYAKAVNQGLELSSNEIKAIANNDIRVSSNWQQVAQAVFEGDQNTYSVHFRMIGYDDSFNPGNLVAYTGKERWCSSSFFVIKSNDPAQYDENYLNSYEDWDMWQRIRRSGYKTAYTNKAEYQHKDSFSQQFIPDRNERNDRNRRHFFDKWGFYPEEQFEKEYPEQMKERWKPFP